MFYKKILLLISVVSISIASLAEARVAMPIAPESIVIKFGKSVSDNGIRSILGAESAMAPFTGRRELMNGFGLYGLKEGASAANVKSLVRRLAGNSGVTFASPLYDADGTRMALTNEVIVKIAPEAAGNVLSSIVANYGAKIVKSGLLNANINILKLSALTGMDVLEISDTINSIAGVEYAQPNYIRLLNRLATIPDDTYFSSQWNLNNTGQFGWTFDADIDAPEAWDINRGSATVSIAIIDEGVDLTHEDLIANLLPGYDATGQGSGGGPNSWDGHGTSCAGIASAVSNNARGVAGVNWNVKIIPVRIAYSPVSCKGCYWVTTDAILADGIQWAADNGADVLSNSWGGGLPAAVINNAILYAKTNGRGGLGSVVAFASGNGNGPIIYPATNPNVLAVGATSPCDERKSPTSCDGETWWGSSYGPELDIAAPGVRIYTTDIMGAGGYTAGNYMSNFNGTSSATPHVAGLAGLIISADPSLTATQVEYVIMSSADDLGPPGRDNQFGYGRINAYNALMSLSGTFGFSGTTTYGGVQTGTSYIDVYQQPAVFGSPDMTVDVTTTGPYSVSGLSNGNYYAVSFIDTDSDGVMGPDDPWGYAGYPGGPTVITIAGADVTGVNITLYDPGAVSGTISYGGAERGQIYMGIFLGSVMLESINMPVVGGYTMGGLLPARYSVKAFMDVNFNGRFNAGEPFGVLNGVATTEGATTTGADFTLN